MRPGAQCHSVPLCLTARWGRGRHTVASLAPASHGEGDLSTAPARACSIFGIIIGTVGSIMMSSQLLQGKVRQQVVRSRIDRPARAAPVARASSLRAGFVALPCIIFVLYWCLCQWQLGTRVSCTVPWHPQAELSEFLRARDIPRPGKWSASPRIIVVCLPALKRGNAELNFDGGSARQLRQRFASIWSTYIEIS